MGKNKNPKKQKAHEIRNIARAAYRKRVNEEREIRSQFPEFVFDTVHGNPDLVAVVREAAKKLSFVDPKQFDAHYRGVFKRMREVGFAQTFREAKSQYRLHPEEGAARYLEHLLLFKVGQVLFDIIPEDVRRNYLPHNDVQVTYVGRQIVLKFSTLKSVKGAHGTVYYGRREPKIDFDGEEYTVAFSRHAIERLCERVHPGYLSYEGAGDMHAKLTTCVYFEPAELANGDKAFVIYEGSEPGMCSYSAYVEKVLGVDKIVRGAGPLYYRVGYCPVVLEDRFAKATTFLHPGYKGTPEYRLVQKAQLSSEERAVLLQQASEVDSMDILLNDDPSVIKWFHDHGIPQVVQMKHTVYESLSA